jgi:serine protease AprX
MLCLLGASWSLHAQDHMWVFFTDKGVAVEDRLAEPTAFLSQESIAQKAAKGITITEQDLPVSCDYLSRLEACGAKITGTSRWMNAAVLPMDSQWDEVLALPFVKGVKPVGVLVRAEAEGAEGLAAEGHDPELRIQDRLFMYGRARHQNDMLDIASLHNRNLTGKGVKVAIFDAGFTAVDTIDVFDSLRNANGIIAAYDFVDNDADPYHGAAHGTQVLSTIAANMPGRMIGTAPHVKVLLARTENGRSETQQEEYNWVRAMEWADSIGVDIIHSSLGYNLFDDQAENYAYEDLDGNTAIISRAADRAAARGIIVTVSAGNEGSVPWRYITAPCDADSVLCIGSVDRYEKHSLFSSLGPTPDGRVKPDVVAMGSRATVASPNNRISSSNGTSFSSPIVAGMVACLRQAHPDRSNMDIIQAVRLSGDQYNFPDEKYGYGIPNAKIADSLLTHVKDLSKVKREMSEKPVRGRPRPQVAQQKPVLRYQPQFTANPTTQISQTAKVLKLSNESQQIKGVKVMQGKKEITLDAKSIKVARSGKKAKVVSKYLKEGEYYLEVVLDDSKEYLPFRKE